MNKIKDKVETKIDLGSKILETINTKMPELSSSYRRLISYFLREDLISTLGKTSFDGDEIDILSTKGKASTDPNKNGTKDGILLTTIFDSNYKIDYRTNGIDAYKVPKDENGFPNPEEAKKIFSLTIGPNVITNTIVAPKGIIGPEFSEYTGFELESTYEVNIPDTAFKYSCGEPGKEPSFRACLSGFNAKFSSLEMLNYSRETPPVEKEKNIFKRLGKSRIERGEGVINITTSSSLTELTDYADDIFSILKREAVKVARKEDSNYGKYLRAINEEQ